MSFLGTIVKEAVIMTAVGALLAVAAPAIAVALHLAPTMMAAHAMLGVVSPAVTGMFFGTFGAIAAVVRPFVTNTSDGISHHFHPKQESAVLPQLELSQDMGVAHSANFAAKLDQERMTQSANKLR